jgi:hypothetical protein
MLYLETLLSFYLSLVPILLVSLILLAQSRNLFTLYSIIVVMGVKRQLEM